MNDSQPAPDDGWRPTVLSWEAVALYAVESRLGEACRLLIVAAERPGPLRRDLLAAAASLQALQRRALEEARSR